MSALLVCLLTLLQGQDTPAAAVQALTPLEAVGGGVSSGAARIGQPIEWRVHVEGAALGRDNDERAREHELEALGWVLLDGPVYDGDSTRRYTLLALDPGQRTTLELQLALAGGGVAVAPAVTLEVLGELAEGEDAPRPARGFRAVDDLAVLSPGALGVALGVFVLAVGGVFVFVRLRRRAPVPVALGPTAAQRLAALTPELDPLTLVGALGPLVRALVDEAAGEDRAALTDEEWRARLALPPELAERAVALVERSTEARFSGRAPSVLGAKELLATSRELERALQRASETAHTRALERASEGAHPRALETADPRALDTAHPPPPVTANPLAGETAPRTPASGGGA